MYIENSRGPRTDPCGNPYFTGACTMIVDEQIQSYRISFELTKPNHSNLALLVP